MQERQGASRGAQLLIAVAGTLAGHALAYRIDSTHLHADGVAHVHAHSWLPWVAAIVAPLALLAMGRLALAELRSGVRLISFARLLRWQVVLFAGQEAIERMTAGGNPLTLLAAPVGGRVM